MFCRLISKQQNISLMKNIYITKKQDVMLPQKKTIDFILNYSKSLTSIQLNKLILPSISSMQN